MDIPKPTNYKKAAWKILGIAVLIILAVLLIRSLGAKRQSLPPPTAKEEQDLSKPSAQARVLKQDTAAVLAAFPEGFPVEQGVQNTASYKYIPANSLEQQSTVEYVSKKTLAENKKIFTDYLAKAGFKIINQDEKSGRLFYYATKDNNDLSIMLTEKSGQVAVAASYLKR